MPLHPVTTDQRVHADTALIVIQSRLYMPNYVGPGRWVIFNPRVRSAFLAVGGAREKVRSGNQHFSGMSHQDMPPPAIKFLREASHPLGSAMQDEARSKRLSDARMLSPSPTEDFPTYLSRYQLAVYNYPFHDYSDPDWLEKDVQRMRKFARMWDPPSLDADYTGRRIALPAPGSLVAQAFGAKEKVTLTALSHILRYAFGPIGTVNFKFGDFHHKTSPSGGARHPAEGIVVIRQPLESIMPGAYHYLPQEHVLVECEELQGLAKVSGASIEIFCRLHVERAMFRYREIRSWRPVLLDVGHVTETIRLLAGMWGIPTSFSIPRVPARTEMATLDNPIVAAVRLGTDIAIGGSKSARTYERLKEQDAGPANEVYTNPFMCLTFDGGQLCANVVHPMAAKIAISPREFELLSYCIPSLRDDRPTDDASLAARYPEIETWRLRLLMEQSVLLPGAEAHTAYDQTSLWSRYGWYLSLLAHLETRSFARGAKVSKASPLRVEVIEGMSAGELGKSLATRRTCRNFEGTEISINDFDAILSSPGGDLSPQMQLHAVLHSVQGYPAGTVGTLTGESFRDSGKRLTREQVREMVIGQYPSSAGALTIWLTSDTDPRRPEAYEGAIAQLGALAQRIILAATRQGLAVFCTPAINDELTSSRLGMPDESFQTITYVLAIGYRRRTEP